MAARTLSRKEGLDSEHITKVQDSQGRVQESSAPRGWTPKEM